MLTSEFSAEMASLIRSLQDRIQKEPDLKEVTSIRYDTDHARADLDRAIIRLIALRLSL